MTLQRHLAPEIEIILPDGTRHIYKGWHIATIQMAGNTVTNITVVPFERETPATIYHSTRYTIHAPAITPWQH